MASNHDKNVKKRKKREEKRKARKNDAGLNAAVSAEEKQMGKVGIIIFVAVGIAAAIFIVSSYS